MARRAPWLLGGFFVLATVLCLITAWTLFVPHGPMAVIWAIKPAQYDQLLALGPGIGWGFVALALVMAATALGCLRRRRWGWGLAVAVLAVNGVADLARAATGDPVAGLTGALIVAAVLVWLLSAPVRQAFASGPPPQA